MDDENEQGERVSDELTCAAVSRLGPEQSQKHMKAMRVTRMGMMMAKASQTGLMPLSLDEPSRWNSEIDICRSIGIQAGTVLWLLRG